MVYQSQYLLCFLHFFLLGHTGAACVNGLVLAHHLATIPVETALIANDVARVTGHAANIVVACCAKVFEILFRVCGNVVEVASLEVVV